MTKRELRLLFVAAGLFGVLVVYAAAHYFADAQDAPPRTVRGDIPSATRAFLAAAEKAEVISDPLERCLEYPDPPGSHWSHPVIAAYCRNQLTTGFSFAEVKAQIEAGHARAVDQRMQELLQAQLSGKGVPGLFDVTCAAEFGNTSADVRPVLDAWKRQSPQSAFAYAASGMNYLQAARDARGAASVADTPQLNFDAMQRLSVQAASDLGHAVALDSRMIPAYAAMITLGGLNGDKSYAISAARRGLEVEPSDYFIYSRLVWLSQPKWGGSVAAMRRVIADSQQHVADNPLLALLRHQADAVAAGMDDCGCTDSVDPAVYRVVLDQPIAKSWLGGAGLAASKASQNDLAVIYLSEALRFAPKSTNFLESRAISLSGLGEHAWALADANRAIELKPTEKTAWTARGYAYRTAGDYTHAEADYRVALNLEPGDEWTLDELGRIYIYSTHEFDKGWDVANQMIQNHPDDPDGWIKASIQKDQPRPGLDDTINYFLAHFGNDPGQGIVVAQMRQTLAQERKRH